MVGKGKCLICYESNCRCRFKSRTDKMLELSMREYNNSQIAKIMKVSRERVRQVLKEHNLYSPVAVTRYQDRRCEL